MTESKSAKTNVPSPAYFETVPPFRLRARGIGYRARTAKGLTALLAKTTAKVTSNLVSPPPYFKGLTSALRYV